MSGNTKHLWDTVVTYLEYRRKNIKVWRPCNLYPSAKIGRNVSIGMFSEIGKNVEIGEGTRIGAHCFIPEGVKIGKNCFLGPHTVFSNDRFPPSHKWQWQQTVVEDNVSIGAGVCIRPGITIKQGSLIGMGSVVTWDIPEDELWIGNPARFLRQKHDIYEHVTEKYDEIEGEKK